MKLFYSQNSPYARKCRVVAIEKGLERRLELVAVNPMENPPELIAANPLGSVPALIIGDGRTLCESPVICEYLNSLSPSPQLIPADPQRHFDDLALAALADGIMDAAVSCVLESRKTEAQRSADWIKRKENAILRTVNEVAKHGFDSKTPLTIGVINVVVALNYVSFRLPHLNWRKEQAALTRWYDDIIQRPSFATTAPAA